jgi:hypothetical protein
MKITAIKTLLATVSLALVPVTSSAAATVSIMVIETGGWADTGTGAASLWESGMMDVFFDTGHIVSNAPALRISTADNEILLEKTRRSFEEAYESGADYFVITQLDYVGGEFTGNQKPERVSLRVYKLHPYSVLYDKNYDADFPVSEIFSNAKNAAMILVPYLRGGS